MGEVPRLTDEEPNAECAGPGVSLSNAIESPLGLGFQEIQEMTQYPSVLSPFSTLKK
jgi:hypothetical protein